MLAILLKILSVIGIILLILLGIVLLLLLLVLFFPITYKIYGNKKAEDILARIKADWLFGFLRLRFYYPDPGNVLVKLLCFTIYDSKAESVPSEGKSEVQQKPQETNENPSPSGDEKQQPATNNATVTDMEAAPNNHSEKEKKSLKQLILEKYDKIKYTIQKIYDKIKHILENISFYKELFMEEETKALLGHARKRLVKIVRKIFPKKLKADLLYGADSPDTTGYVLAAYSVLIPNIRKPYYIHFTPDFSQAILEGEIDAKGHITVFSILINVLAVVLDKRLRRLIHKIKRHSLKQKKS